DEELLDAARNFLRSGGLEIDLTAKVAHASKILKWYSIDFGKSEVEVIRHVSNYLDPADSEILLDLLATSELKVVYQPYDWGLNC
ncbi:vacuolar membrane-associated protein IML1, partial [Trifolium medium]|nr:vacuolar membrane-associated protein IML1 [Trifolium medium]